MKYLKSLLFTIIFLLLTFLAGYFTIGFSETLHLYSKYYLLILLLPSIFSRLFIKGRNYILIPCLFSLVLTFYLNEVLFVESLKNNIEYSPRLTEINIGNRDRIINSKLDISETNSYIKLINSGKILDAYYLTVDVLSSGYSYDFSVKNKSLYNQLLEDYYSIDEVEEKAFEPGYSEIVIPSKNDLVRIDYLVESSGKIYLFDVNIDGKEFEYLVVDSSGKIYTKGFNRDFYYISGEFTEVNFPVPLNELKLYSKEFKGFLDNSMILRLTVCRYLDSINYENCNYISTLIIDLLNYLLVFIVFLIPNLYYGRYSTLNYIYSSIAVFIFVSWLINKISLVLISYSLGLSILFVLVAITSWLLFIELRLKLLPARF